MVNVDQQMKTTFVKPMQVQNVIFEFKTSTDWRPGEGGCWIDCPFAVCTALGQRCRALINSNCPFAKNIVNDDDRERDFN